MGLCVPSIGFEDLAAFRGPPLTVIQPSVMQPGVFAMRRLKRLSRDGDPSRVITPKNFLPVCASAVLAVPTNRRRARIGTGPRR